eukprot:s1276_g34.t1
MPSTQSTLKRPASSKVPTPSLKRPASSINDAVNKLKKASQALEDEPKHDDDSGDEGDSNRDKSKGQEYAKMKDQLPLYVQDLIEQEGKKPRREEQTLSGKTSVNKEQEKLLKAAFEGVGWDWNYSKPKDMKIFEKGNQEAPMLFKSVRLAQKMKENLPLTVIEVPSAYFLADAFYHLDYLMQHKLLLPDLAAGQTRLDRAAEEGIRAKRCVVSLRYLWRNSPGGAHSPQVLEMKEYLQSSPVQLRRLENMADQDQQGQNDSSSSDEERGPPRDDPENNEDVAGDNDSTDDDAASNNGDLETPVNPEGSYSQDSLNAPTLRLGWESEVDTPPSQDSDGEPRDSQRPGAWMGKFYKNHRTMGDLPSDEPVEIKSHDETDHDGSDDDDDEQPGAGDLDGEPLSDNDWKDKGDAMDDNDAVDSALDYIKRALNLGGQHVMDLTMHELGDDYMGHCKDSFHKSGLCVRNLLASNGHFHKWALEVNCKQSAFVVKRAKPGLTECAITGQVTWSRFGGAEQAWNEAKKRAGVLGSSNEDAAAGGA